MPWPIPSAKTIAEALAATLEIGLTRIRPLVDPLAISRSVRSEKGFLAQVGRAFAAELRQTHEHVSWWARQYFPDSAEEEFALRHASIWGVDQRAATTAIGAVDIEGVPGTVLPSGIEFAGADGILFTSTAGATIAGNGMASVPVIASVAGPAGNLSAATRLRTALPYPEIDRVTVSAEGIAGGASEETMRQLSAATVERIRQRAHGGAGFDYPLWLDRAFDVRAVSVIPEWIGKGSVGVVTVMKVAGAVFGRAPTSAELDAMSIYIGRPGTAEGVRPVTAHVTIVAGEVTPVPITVRLRPDTTAIRATVTEAYARFVATIGDADDEANAGPIGAKIERSRISEAISAADGEYAHDLVLPAAAIQLGRVQYPVPGAITWAAPV